jgi:hypothetical protein
MQQRRQWINGDILAGDGSPYDNCVHDIAAHH